jgi:hypothetical protein
MTPKEKRFISILAGITVVCVGGLYFFASKGSSRFDAAKQQFDAVDSEIKSMEGLPVYPTEKNLALKEAELKTYSANAEELSKKLQALRPANLENTDPQAFTDLLVKTADASIKAYQTAGLSSEGDNPSLPKGFYLGFEAYTSTPAQKDSTGIMTYQLGAISELNAVLAASKPSALLNFRREALPEEKNEAYKPTPGVPYRALPIEVAFAGPESALRAFINGIQSSKQHYFVIRSMRVRNDKQEGPKASDAQFEAPAKEGADAGAPGGGIFDSGAAFVLPGESAPAAPAEAAAAAAPAAAEPEKAEDAPADSSRILQQVLGQEDVNAFFRIDIILFDGAPATAAPKK